jgi:DNA-binding NarL/FixJ family response regulator
MPDVILLDVGLPGLSGFEVVQKLVQEETPVRVLVLSAHDNIHYIQGLLKLGVAGYLVKDEMMSTILEAIRSVARGEQGWISRRVAAQLSQWQRRENEKVGKLSQRELEVLEALVNGKTNQEIGLLLGISEKTIEKHLDGIFVKLGVSSRVEAAVYATREGWFGEA